MKVYHLPPLPSPPVIFVALLTLSLAGCGGGSTASAPSPTPPPTPTSNIAVTITACPTVVQRGVTIVNGTPVYTCTASVSNSSNTAVTWTSSSTSSLKIDLTTGVLTPLLRGSVIITATSAADTTKSASVTIKVVDRLFTSQAEPLPWLPGLNGMLLFYLETDGSDSAELLTTRECWDPAVSPDHKHVACGTFVIPTDSVQFQSTELIVVTTDGTAAGTSASTPLANVQTFSYAWSPDGKKIVFVGARKDPANSANTLVGVFTINADLSGMTQLTSESFAGNTIRFPGPASFSPDGKSIIYNVTADNNIRVMNVDGTNPMVLPVVGDGPVFTRDGSKILFVNFTWDSAQSRYISQIESMNPDGNNVQAIVNPGFSVQDFYYDIAISPDGLQIAYDDSNVGPGKIYIANVDGSGATAIPGGGSQGIGW